MDNLCFGDVCKSLEVQSPEKAAECVKTRTVDEDIDGCKLFFLHLLKSRDLLWEFDDSMSEGPAAGPAIAATGRNGVE
jgi:hypothetical protein